MPLPLEHEKDVLTIAEQVARMEIHRALEPDELAVMIDRLVAARIAEALDRLLPAVNAGMQRALDDLVPRINAAILEDRARITRAEVLANITRQETVKAGKLTEVKLIRRDAAGDITQVETRVPIGT